MDKEEFAEVVINATDSLYRVSFAILGNEADCEDAVGEAIATAFSKLYTLRQEKYAKTWLTKILIRECYASLADSKYVIDGFFFGDSDGKRYVDMGNGSDRVTSWMSFTGPCSYAPGVVDGKFTGTYEFAIEQNFNIDTDIIRFIPYTVEHDVDGKHIPGTEKEIPELSFEVNLK